MKCNCICFTCGSKDIGHCEKHCSSHQKATIRSFDLSTSLKMMQDEKQKVVFISGESALKALIRRIKEIPYRLVGVVPS